MGITMTMTMRNTDFANLLRSHTKHRVPLRLHAACPAAIVSRISKSRKISTS